MNQVFGSLPYNLNSTELQTASHEHMAMRHRTSKPSSRQVFSQKEWNIKEKSTSSSLTTIFGDNKGTTECTLYNTRDLMCTSQ